MSAIPNRQEYSNDDDDAYLIANALYNAQGFDNALSRVRDYIREAEDKMQRDEWRRIAQELTNLCTADPQCQAKRRLKLH
jgi:hypothetical protein